MRIFRTFEAAASEFLSNLEDLFFFAGSLFTHVFKESSKSRVWVLTFLRVNNEDDHKTVDSISPRVISSYENLPMKLIFCYVLYNSTCDVEWPSETWKNVTHHEYNQRGIPYLVFLCDVVVFDRFFRYLVNILTNKVKNNGLMIGQLDWEIIL